MNHQLSRDGIFIDSISDLSLTWPSISVLLCLTLLLHRCLNSTEAFFCRFVFALFLTLPFTPQEPHPVLIAAQVLMSAQREDKTCK